MDGNAKVFFGLWMVLFVAAGWTIQYRVEDPAVSFAILSSMLSNVLLTVLLSYLVFNKKERKKK